MKELSQAINESTHHADFEQDVIDQNEFYFKEMLEVVCGLYFVNKEDLLSDSRDITLVKVRNIMFFIMRHYHRMKWSVISSLVGRDHSTTIFGCNKIACFIKSDPMLSSEVREVCRRYEKIILEPNIFNILYANSNGYEI